MVYWLLTHYIVRPSQQHESTRPMDSVKSYIQSHRQAFEADLAELLRIPSVRDVKVDTARERVIITFDARKTHAPDLHDAILKSGYKPAPIAD